MAQHSRLVQSNSGYQRLIAFSHDLFVVLALSLGLVACGVAAPRDGGETPPSVTASPILAGATTPPSAFDLESQGIMIDRAMRDGPFASSYGGLYTKDNRNIVLATDDPSTIQKFLVSKGITASTFEVRRVRNSLARLQQVEIAARRGLEQFPGTWAVATDVIKNKVVIGVAREPFEKLTGYHAGNEVIPYDQWPDSLKTALKDFVPGTEVELRANFSVEVNPQAS